MSSKKNSAHPLLGASKGKTFVVSAPAGTGKTTLANFLTDEFSTVKKCITYTTRQPRPGEVQGKDYFFCSKDEFEQMIDSGAFLEFVHLYGNYYGTPKSWIQEQAQKGQHTLLVIDTQGAMKVKEGMEAVFIFVSPPSIATLKERLEKRQSESEESLSQRLALAEHEMTYAKYYDYLVINDDLDLAYEVLRAIVVAEVHKQKKC